MTIEQFRKPWKGTMTARERFNNQMNYKSFDRCFNMEFGYWEENFREWDLFQNNNIKTNDSAHEFFGFDRIVDYWTNVWMSPKYEEKIIEEKETTNIMQDENGLIVEVPKDGHETIPHYLDYSIKTPEDWKRCKEERFRINSPDRKFDIDDFLKKHPNNRDYPVGIYCGSMIGRVRDMLTFEGLSYATVDYPDMVEDMVETSCQIIENLLDQVLPHIQFDYASGWEDISCKGGPLISKKFFYNIVVPRYKRIGKKLKKAGIDLWYTDCDGDVRPLLPGFLESGINCLFPYEINSCVHPAELLNEYGKDLRIMGGFDKMQLIAGKPEIKKYMESLIPLVERGGYIPFCDHRCPPDVTVENYLYYLDLKEEIFGLK